jgi:hypothetical protein
LNCRRNVKVHDPKHIPHKFQNLLGMCSGTCWEHVPDSGTHSGMNM